MKQAQEWEIYERMIAQLIADQVATDMCVTPNARLPGAISGRSRQIDVLIDSRHDTDFGRRIIVDAKKRGRRIDIREVEGFRGLMEDVGATHGYLVSPVGYTRAAEKRAQEAVSIRIVLLNRIENFDPSTWPRCKSVRCKYGRVFWDGYPELSMVLQPTSPSEGRVSRHVRYVHYVGKCDRCGRFHVKCLACGDVLSTPDADDQDYGHQCSCKPPWIWLASIEEDEQGRRSAELHACLGTGRVITVDRRSL